LTNNNSYPVTAFNFEVKFNGGGISGEAGFQQVSGLDAQLGVEEVTAGGGGTSVHRLPKPASFQNLVLKRGVIANSSLRNWAKKAIFDFEFNPVTVTINLLNSDQKPIMTWVAHNAWPLKWSIGSFHSQENQLALETFELVYDSLTVKL